MYDSQRVSKDMNAEHTGRPLCCIAVWLHVLLHRRCYSFKPSSHQHLHASYTLLPDYPQWLYVNMPAACIQLKYIE
jgi:hypothetical protein